MPWPAVAHDNIDMKKTRTLITLGLLLGLAGGVTGSARAEQETTPTTPATPQENTPATTTPTTKPVEQQLSGRIVAVDKSSRTITLQVNNQTYVLKTADDTKFNIAGQQKSLNDLVVGEEVNVTVALRESSTGRVEIAVVSVESTGADAQDRDGRGHGRGRGRGFEGHHPPPFVNLPNPANVGGHSRSPHR